MPANTVETAGERPAVTRELTVRVLSDGSVQVEGPIHDLMMCYGLLECAKDALRNSHMQAASPRILHG